MLGIRIEPELESRLGRLAQETGQTKSHLAREAIKQYLDQRQAGRVPDHLLAEHLLEIGARVAAMPVLGTASEDEILGYDEMEGLVGRRNGD
jgi:predicted DNA-binding protein